MTAPEVLNDDRMQLAGGLVAGLAIAGVLYLIVNARRKPCGCHDNDGQGE